VAVGAVRAHELDDPADHFVVELSLTALAVEPCLDGGGHIPPRRLAIHADSLGDGALALTFSQRRSASLIWTTDTSLNATGPPLRTLQRPSRIRLGRRWWIVRVVP